MSPTSVTTRTSWFSRIRQSLGGILFGFIFFGLSFWLLWYNEGRAVRTAKGLKEGAEQVVSVTSDNIDPANNNMLIHFSGTAIPSDTLQDDLLNIRTYGLKLKRNVEVYQWREKSESETKEKIGGAEETVTTYSYDKVWSGSLISSSNFQEAGHDNPTVKLVEDYYTAPAAINIGAFTLSPALVGKIGGFNTFQMPKLNDSLIKRLKSNLQPVNDNPFAFTASPKHQIVNNQLFLGQGSASYPEIGDIRISYSYVPSGPFSVIARQTDGQLAAHTTSHKTQILMLQTGVVTADHMFEQALRQNKFVTWLLRAGGFFLMFLGLSMILRPLVVLASVLPFLGRILNFGTSVFAGVLAAIFSFVTIGLAWVFYRPILGISLLVIALGIFVYFYRRGRDKDLPEDIRANYLKK